MIPGTLNLKVYQRATFRQGFDLNADLSGYQVYAQIWDKPRRTKYADFTVQWTDQAAGQFDLVLSYATTTALTKDAFWDLLLEEPSGERNYWLEGEVKIDPGYTEPSA